MPTGYTAGVQDGTVTDFAEYALTCARAFGATIMLRDEPLSSDIPEFEPSDYHTNAITTAEAELLRLTTLSIEDANAEAAKARADEIERRDNRRLENAQQRERYERMLAKARQFKAPTPEHISFAEFLVSQLTESIDWDCGEFEDSELPVVNGHEWRCNRMADLQENIGYHKEKHAEEVQRTKQRNEWVKQLREALELAIQ